jgi:hypothetical protein
VVQFETAVIEVFVKCVHIVFVKIGAVATRAASGKEASTTEKKEEGDKNLSSWFKNLLSANSAGKQAEEAALALAKPILSAQQTQDQRSAPQKCAIKFEHSMRSGPLLGSLDEHFEMN